MSEFNEQKAHYESLISLFKYVIGLLTGLMITIGGIIGYITYKDGVEMRAELENRRTELKSELSDLKKEMKDKEDEAKSKFKELAENINKDVDRTRTEAIGEIGNIRISSSTLAQQEARRKIGEVFENKNFDSFVEKIATERIEPKINDLVDKKVSQVKKLQIETAIENLASSEYVIFNNGVAFFDYNQDIQLSETEIQQIINIFEKNKKNEDRQDQIARILSNKKSANSTSFFKKLLYVEEFNHPQTQNSIIYLIQFNLEHSFLINYISKEMSKSNQPYNLYIHIASLTSGLSANYLEYLLNSKLLVNQVFSSLPNQQFIAMKASSIEQIAKSALKPEVYRNTYLFTIH